MTKPDETFEIEIVNIRWKTGESLKNLNEKSI